MYLKVCEYVRKENGDTEIAGIVENHPFMTGKEKIPVKESSISEKEYIILQDAGNRLCHFCQGKECEHCQVAKLVDDARSEAEKAGIRSDS